MSKLLDDTADGFHEARAKAMRGAMTVALLNEMATPFTILVFHVWDGWEEGGVYKSKIWPGPRHTVPPNVTEKADGYLDRVQEIPPKHARAAKNTDEWERIKRRWSKYR